MRWNLAYVVSKLRGQGMRDSRIHQGREILYRIHGRPREKDGNAGGGEGTILPERIWDDRWPPVTQLVLHV